MEGSSQIQNSVIKAIEPINNGKRRKVSIVIAIALILAILIGVFIIAAQITDHDKHVVESSVEYYDTDDGSLSSSYNYNYEYDNKGRIYEIKLESSSTYEFSSGSSVDTEHEEVTISYTEMRDMYYGNGTAYDEDGEKQYDIQLVYDNKYNLLSETKIYDDSLLSDSYEEYTYYDEKGRRTEYGFRENGENTEYFVYEYGDNDEYIEYYYFDGNLEYKKEGQLIKGIFSGQVTEYDSDGNIQDTYNVTVDEVERNVYKQNDGNYEIYYYYEGSSNRCIKVENYNNGILRSKTQNVFQ